MATGKAASDRFSGRSGYELRADVVRNGVSGNRSRYRIRLRARYVSGGNYSYNLDNNYWTANVEGTSYSGRHNLDFRNTTEITLLDTTGPYKSHNADGYLTVNFSASMNTSGIFGSAGFSSSFSADRIPKAPSTPRAPKYKSATPSRVTFSISYPSDDGGRSVSSYNMRVYTASSGGSLVAEWNSGSSTQTSPALPDPNTNYYVTYRAKNSIGYSSFSSRVRMRTAVAKPGVPSGLAVSNLAPTSATLSWSPPGDTGGDTIDGYTIQRASNEAFTVGVVSYNQSGTSKEFTDLAPSTDYYFRVRAKNSAGDGAYSSPLKVTTVSGAYVSIAGSWVPAGVFVSDGTNWLPAEVFVSDGTTWVNTV